MNLRDLKYVEAVALHRNFSRAAHACNVSQPALSRQIKKLEEELGVNLFERSTNEVQLTEFGEQAVVSAKKILRQTDMLHEIAMHYREVEALPFKIGMTPTLAPYLTKYFRDMLHKLYPDLRVVLIEEKPVELARKVEKQEIDIALIARKSHERMYYEKEQSPVDFSSLWMEPLFLGVSKTHALASHDSIKAQDVPAELLIRFSVPFGYDLEQDLPEVTECMEEQNGFDVSATRFETVCRHIPHSDNCTIINAVAASQFKRDNWGIHFLEFEDAGNHRDIGMISRPGYSRKNLLNAIGEYINQNAPDGVRPIYNPH